MFSWSNSIGILYGMTLECKVKSFIIRNMWPTSKMVRNRVFIVIELSLYELWIFLMDWAQQKLFVLDFSYLELHFILISWPNCSSINHIRLIIYGFIDHQYCSQFLEYLLVIELIWIFESFYQGKPAMQQLVCYWRQTSNWE